MSFKPIPTKYKGYIFRSRLEAKWAVFLDALGVKYEYEPEGFVLPSGKWYLPDFRVKCYGVRGASNRHYQDDNDNKCGTCVYGHDDAYAYQGDCLNKNMSYDKDQDGNDCSVSGVITSDANGTIRYCPGWQKDTSNEPFDLYIEVKPGNKPLSKDDADKIREFANIPNDNYDFDYGVKTNPVLVVTDIPYIEFNNDLYQSYTFDCYKDIGFDVHPFNYQFIDGDLFGAFPAAARGGYFYLCGDDGNYFNFNYLEEKKLAGAYRIARQARFEHGEDTKIQQLINQLNMEVTYELYEQEHQLDRG